jgi:hypothetical protein
MTPSANEHYVSMVAHTIPLSFLHWNRTSHADVYADFTKEQGLHHERITLPTTFNAK